MDIPVTPPQMTVQPKPGFNWWILSTMVLLVLLTLVSTYAFTLWREKMAVVVYEPPMLTGTPPVTGTVTGTVTSKTTPITQSVTMKVPAIGGGGMGQRIDFSFSIPLDPTDVISVEKQDTSMYKNLPDFDPAAVDRSLKILHGDVSLIITPQFEGAGSVPLKQKISPLFTNTKLSSLPIYRIDSSLENLPERMKSPGSYYTVAYKENKSDCPENSATDPACVWSEGVEVNKNDPPLYITCTVEGTAATWCDSVVKNMSAAISRIGK